MEWYKQKLLVNYDALTNAESGIDVNHVTDYLRRDNAVRRDEYEDIHSGSNCRVRAERLLETLLEKDIRAYTYFCDALRENYPHFAKLLDETPLDQCDGIRLHRGNQRKMTSGKPLSPGVTSFLPAPSAIFVGRELEKQECRRWLQSFDASRRMYTLIGPPGVGKTALIVNTCRQFIQSRSLAHPDKTCLLFFDLRSLEAVEDLAVDMLMHLQNLPGKSPINHLLNVVRNFQKDLVLVLDNAEDAMVEQLKDKFLKFVKNIIGANARVRLVITSRVSVKLLSVNVCEVKLNPLDTKDGVSLTKHLVPSLEPELVSRLCQLTGYLPLGLHLLAILVQGEDNPCEIISALEKTPDSTLNAIDSVEGIPSSSKLINCFSTSFDRLDQTQQSCIIACSVFPTGFDRRAAQYVFHPTLLSDSKTPPLVKSQKLLRSLIDRSMLMFDEESRRYSIHPLFRSFCETVAKDHSERWDYSNVRKRYCEYYINFAEIMKELFFEKDSCSEAVQQFWSERQNIEHAIQFCLSCRHITRLLLGFASRRGIEFLRITINDKLICKLYVSLLESLESHEHEEKSVVLTALGFYARVVEHNFEASLSYAEEANNLQVAENVTNIEHRTFCMHSMAKIYAVLGRFDEAEEIAKRSLKLAMKHPDERLRWGLKGFSVEALAGIHKNQFRQTRDIQKAEQSGEEYNTVLKYLDKFFGNHIFQRYIYFSHAELQRDIGDFRSVLSSLEQALQVQDIVMGSSGVDHAMVHYLIGEAHIQLQDDQAALESFKTAFEVSSQVLGASPKTKAAGEKVIEILKQMGESEQADWYANKLTKIMSSVSEC